MRGPLVALALCAVPAVAHAQGRLALTEIPDVTMYEAIWPLGYEHDGDLGLVGSFGLGFGKVRPEKGPTATATGAIGFQTECLCLLAVARSELTGWAPSVDHLELQRGHHQALAQIRPGEDLGLVLALSGTLDHGDAPGLAPAHLGGGRRTTGDALGEAMMFLDPDDDETFAFSARGTAGMTEWANGRSARRRGLELAFGYAPTDDELPRGMIDFVHGRVQHTRIESPVALAALPGVAGATEVRQVEVGLGAHDMTAAIDHQLAAIIAVDFGWAWLEADSPAGSVRDNLFRMRLSADTRWRDRRRGRLTRVGLGIGREPGHTEDGSRLVADWRFELIGELEARRAVLSAHGGISWLIPLKGGTEESALVRYGSQLEAFLKLGKGLEVGGYHAAHYDPAPGDPWASGRRWGVEAGVMVRIRTDQAARAYRPSSSSSDAYPASTPNSY